jgi:hypothetical protein
MLAALFITFCSAATFGGVTLLVSVTSDRPADRRYVFPSALLSAAGTVGVAVMLIAL